MHGTVRRLVAHEVVVLRGHGEGVVAEDGAVQEGVGALARGRARRVLRGGRAEHGRELLLDEGLRGVLGLDQPAVRGDETRDELRHERGLGSELGEGVQQRLGHVERALVELPLDVVQCRVQHPLHRGGLARQAG